MFPVSIRKIIPIILVGLISLQVAMAQRATSHHFDQRKFNLGFTMGINFNTFNMTHQINTYDPVSGVLARDIEMIGKPGLTLGLIVNLNLHNNIDFRIMPSVSLEQRDLDFFLTDVVNGFDTVATRTIENSNLNIPFMIRFKSDFYDVYRVYVQTGIQISFNLASTKKVLNNPELIKVSGTDIMWVTGFGVDLYGEKLKLNPEIRFAMGLKNVYIPKNTRFGTIISDLFSQSLMFLINFE